ncbi:MAG: flagellar hook-associated protein FlgK [Phycisphaerae bacterium]|nr:flagellar hook-associated protein FlgK [Phycisphaerae bacterium]
MSLINGAIQIGKSALTTSQSALSVTGNNMANAATPGYTRQVAHMAPTQTSEVAPGKYAGTGVALYDIRRQVDDALNGRIRMAVSDSASFMTQQQAMSRVEASFNELTDEDLSSRLNAFFSAWSSLQREPQDVASRNVVLQTGDSLTNFVRELRSSLVSIKSDLDDQVRYHVNEADSLASQVATLNAEIVSTEAGRAGASSALRDQRDVVLKQLGELVSISTREVEGGSMNVFIGNEPLIQYSACRGLSYKETVESDGTKTAEVVFSDNTTTATSSGGKIHGLITSRDDLVGGIVSDVDEWATALIFEVNQLHSLGHGLNGMSSATATYSVADRTAALADMTGTELPWQVNNGSFAIQIYDEEGNAAGGPQLVTIDGVHDSLEDMRDKINGNVSGVTASIDGSNRLKLDSSDSSKTFVLTGPGSGSPGSSAFAALGINTFFEGKNGSDITVKTDLRDNPSMVSAASDVSARVQDLSGNGNIAGAIADLASSGIRSLHGISLPDHFTGIVSGIATKTRNIQDNYEAAAVVVSTLEMERQSISGVSMDEESINMITYQRAFQGASRYINLIDQMLDEVMSLI